MIQKVNITAEGIRADIIGLVEPEDCSLDVIDKSYIHEQLVGASTWHVYHELKKYPAVDPVDSTGKKIYGVIQHVSNNYLKIIFLHNVSGKAFCN